MASCDPAQNVDFLRAGETTGQRVGNDLKQRVRGEIFVVVDVGLVFVECELNIGFAELNLLPTRSCAGVEKTGTDLGREFTLSRGGTHLVQELRVAVGEEAVLSEARIPEDLFEIVERGALRQVDLPHGGRDVEQGSKGSRASSP